MIDFSDPSVEWTEDQLFGVDQSEWSKPKQGNGQGRKGLASMARKRRESSFSYDGPAPMPSPDAPITYGNMVIPAQNQQTGTYAAPLAAVKPIRSFAWESMSKFLSGVDNVSYSPLSLWNILAAVMDGSSDSTHDEMETALYAERLGDTDYTALQQAMLSTSGVYRADSIWILDGFNVRMKWSNHLKDVFGIPTFTTRQFNDVTAERMNNWTQRTMNLPFPPKFRPDDDCRLSLVSAIKATCQWSVPFQQQNTRDALFNGIEGKSTVPFMQGRMSVPYMEGNGWKATFIPFSQGGGMTFLLPDGKQSMRMILGKPEGIKAVFENIKEAPSTFMDVRIPRLTVESVSRRIIQRMKRMELREMFSEKVADFSEMAARPSHLAVTDIEQWTSLSINEGTSFRQSYESQQRQQGYYQNGYGMAMAGNAAGYDSIGGTRFKLDKPFIYEYETKDGIPVLIGAINSLRM